MDRRLSKLEVVYQADAQAVSECSYSIEWALKWPRMGLRESEPTPDPVKRAANIAGSHGLDDAGVRRAIEVAFIRTGATRSDARALADMGLAWLLAFTVRETEAA